MNPITMKRIDQNLLGQKGLTLIKIEKKDLPCKTHPFRFSEV